MLLVQVAFGNFVLTLWPSYHFTTNRPIVFAKYRFDLRLFQILPHIQFSTKRNIEIWNCCTVNRVCYIFKFMHNYQADQDWIKPFIKMRALTYLPIAVRTMALLIILVYERRPGWGGVQYNLWGNSTSLSGSGGLFLGHTWSSTKDRLRITMPSMVDRLSICLGKEFVKCCCFAYGSFWHRSNPFPPTCWSFHWSITSELVGTQRL